MILQEVLQLDKVQASIKKIDLFLSSQVKFSDEYIIALSYKAIVLHTIGKTNEALKLLFGIVPILNKIGTNGVIAICDGIIDICLDLKRYDQVTKYIKIKKEYLPISKAVYHIKDNIKYYLAIQEYEKAKEELLKYLKDDITKEEAIYAKEKLADIYFIQQQYDLFLNLADSLYDYYQTNYAITALNELNLKKLQAIYAQGNYLRVIQDGLAFLKENDLKRRHILATATLIIHCYLSGNDFRRASIIESKYSEYIDKECLEESIGFCEAALDLYKKNNSLISIQEYQNKLKELQINEKEHKAIKKKNKEQDIVIPAIAEEEEIEQIKNDKPLYTLPNKESSNDNQRIVTQPETIQTVVVSTMYEKLEGVFQAINELDVHAKFREIFRVCCMKLEELFSIQEAYVLYFKRQYLGIHYKKERAYDKKLEFGNLEDTLNFAAMNYGHEFFLNPEDSSYTKNIIFNRPYETIPYGLAFPFTDSLKNIGSVAFFSDTPFMEQPMYYECLKLISSMLNTRLLVALKQEDFEFNNRRLFFISENMSSGIKEEIDGYLHFSARCCDILGIVEDMTEEDYISKMKSEDIIHYRRIHKELYTLVSENRELEYDFKKNQEWIHIKERYYPMIMDGTVCILSLIDDITSIYQDKEQLIHLAYKNPISKLDTEVKLMVDLNSWIANKKLSLAIIRMNDLDLYRELYGYNFANQLIYAVGQELIRAFETEFYTYVYHLDGDRYVVVLNGINDKRVVDSKLNVAFEKVRKALYEKNNRVKLYFNAGVYRMAKHTTIKDVSEILYYAFDALEDAENEVGLSHHIAHFDGELHKAKFKEKHLITHISESIDHAKLGLMYKQIVRLDKNEVFGYYILLNLDNYEVETDYMDFVVQRRGLNIQLEKYTISNLFKELKMMKDTLKGSVLCFVSVSKPTLEENFYSFILSQYNFFKVPKEYVVLVLEKANISLVQKLRSEGFQIASKDILDVYNECCDYFILDYHKIDLKRIDEIKSLCECHHVVCIFDHIDTKEDLEKVKAYNMEIIFGQYYKKVTRMKSLIEKIQN